MANAWMVRQDGYKIPVTVHVYGAMEDGKVLEDSMSLEENVFAATFVYKYSNREFSRKVAAEVIAKWAIRALGERLEDENLSISNIDNVKDIDLLDGIPYKVVFNNALSMREIWNLVPDSWIKNFDEKLEELEDYSGSEINEPLNQEFMRVRYGGEYDTNSSNKEIYFRISSTGFEWNRVIDKFLSDFGRTVTMITIEKDAESTGSNNVYKTSKGVPIDRLPINSYWTEDDGRIPLIESKIKNIGRIGPRAHLRESLKAGITLTEYLDSINSQNMKDEIIKLFEMTKRRELVLKTVKKNGE